VYSGVVRVDAAAGNTGRDGARHRLIRTRSGIGRFTLHTTAQPEPDVDARGCSGWWDAYDVDEGRVLVLVLVR
jgi:hypothetical protein